MNKSCQLRLQKEQQFNDGYNIKYQNDRDPSMDHYNGTLNLLERDKWNNRLHDRNFVIDYPPWHNIVKPQNSSPCTTPDCYKLLRNPNLDQRAANYWNVYNQRFDPCNHQGIPIHKDQQLSLQFQARTTANCNKDFKTKYGMGIQPCKKDCQECLTQFLPEIYSSTSDKNSNLDQLEQEHPDQPWIYGINRNIDVESKLFGIDDYNDLDTKPNHLRDYPELSDPCTQQSLFDTYFQDNRHIYPNITPKIFHNTTKIINIYPIGPEPGCPGDLLPYRRKDRVDYAQFNQMFKEAEQCIQSQR